MAGVINTNKSGMYMSIEPVIVVGVGVTMALQEVSNMQSKVTFENHSIENHDTIHPVTMSHPGMPGVITGTTHMIGKPATGSSKIFSIESKSVSHSGTKKLQNIGNCPISPMVSSSGHSVRFQISK